MLSFAIISYGPEARLINHSWPGLTHVRYVDQPSPAAANGNDVSNDEKIAEGEVQNTDTICFEPQFNLGKATMAKNDYNPQGVHLHDNTVEWSCAVAIRERDKSDNKARVKLIFWSLY